MKKVLTASIVAVSMGFTGCASIMSGSTQSLSFQSVPDSANISITNRSGEKVHTGQTPATVTLKKGAGFFKPENYQVKFSKAGYQTQTVAVTGTVNGWYVANLIFGGVIGLLIVDPITGAMYTLSPKDVVATLEANGVAVQKGEKSLTVLMVEDVPPPMMEKATKISE
ncbi:MAG: hypothetical protein E6Q26_06515 [Acinetobacter sp.]|nr:MAG: hypothetical protein E6Q26_06515 [Acinetobacter sp.]